MAPDTAAPAATKNVKVWVCMSCKRAHFDPNQDYAECIHAGHAMYTGFVWLASESGDCEVCGRVPASAGSKRCEECQA